MSARDTFHSACRRALEKEGWTVTHDPLRVPFGGINFQIDLGAEQFLGAEKENRRIAVEIKSFIGRSEAQDLEIALGQFVLYRVALEDSEEEKDRVLYLAVRRETYEAIFQERAGIVLLEKKVVRLIVFDAMSEEIVQWTD